MIRSTDESADVNIAPPPMAVFRQTVAESARVKAGTEGGIGWALVRMGTALFLCAGAGCSSFHRERLALEEPSVLRWIPAAQQRLEKDPEMQDAPVHYPLYLYFRTHLALYVWGQKAPLTNSGAWHSVHNRLRALSQALLAQSTSSIRAGGDVNAVDSSGRTALHFAVCNPAVTELLIRHGASLDVQDKHGRTPLHVALGAGRSVFAAGSLSAHYRSAKLLVTAGADLSLKDKNGRRALDCVQPELAEAFSVIQLIKDDD